MGDIDDAHALSLQFSDHFEKTLNLAFGERSGRLIHDHDPSVCAYRFGNLYDLLLRHTQGAYQTLRIDGRSCFLDQHACSFPANLPIDPSPGTRFFQRECDVFRDSQMSEERRLLIDHGDAECSCDAWTVVGYCLIADRQRAGIGDDGAGHNLNEGRLPRPVFPDEGMDFTAEQLEGNAFEGTHSLERFRDRICAQNGNRQSRTPRSRLERQIQHLRQGFAVPCDSESVYDLNG